VLLIVYIVYYKQHLLLYRLSLDSIHIILYNKLIETTQDNKGEIMIESIKNIAQDIFTGAKSIAIPLAIMLSTLFAIDYTLGETVAETVFVTGIITYCLYMMGNIKRPL